MPKEGRFDWSTMSPEQQRKFKEAAKKANFDVPEPMTDEERRERRRKDHEFANEKQSERKKRLEESRSDAEKRAALARRRAIVRAEGIKKKVDHDEHDAGQWNLGGGEFVQKPKPKKGLLGFFSKLFGKK